MTAVLVIIVAIVGVPALITFIGTWLIERAHRPRGRFVDVGGFPQHIIEVGPGDAGDALPVVVLHGASANLEDVHMALGERLGGRRRVIFVDRPGLGFSARPAGQGASPAYQAAVLRNILDQLGIARAIVVGHSWGGTLALTFALDCPERTAGLVLVAPVTHPGVWDRTTYSAILAGPVGWLYSRTFAFPLGAMLMRPGSEAAFQPQTMPQDYVRRSAAMLVLRPRSLMANWADVGCLETFLQRQTERYAALSVPTIILAGDTDTLVPPPRQCEKLAATATCVKVVLLPGFGHMLHHAAADRVIEAVEEISTAAHSRDSAS
ncbi:MAG TPA: alpha/beta hydrolase [Stellaceae bacterium]|nr:alpha/beta hydrolase [Stellaceae bacterium]